jgi:hypothetical protein
MNEEVIQYIQKTQPWQVEVCNTLRDLVLTNVPNVEERLQYGKPHYLKDGSYLAVIHASKDKVSFMLFNATKIPEVKGFLRSMGNGDRKTVDIRDGQSVDYEQLANLVSKVSQV